MEHMIPNFKNTKEFTVCNKPPFHSCYGIQLFIILVIFLSLGHDIEHPTLKVTSQFVQYFSPQFSGSKAEQQGRGA